MNQYSPFSVPARKTLLTILTDEELNALNNGLVENTGKWVEEIISLSDRLGGGAKLIELPNVQIDEHLTFLGNGVYSFLDKNFPGYGYWIHKRTENNLFEKVELWDHLKIISNAALRINNNYLSMGQNFFLPETIEKEGILKKLNRRKVHMMPYSVNNIYAKESSYHIERLEDNHVNLRHIRGKAGLSASSEMKIFEDLSNAGVNVPEVIAIYEGPMEEFIFMPEIRGIDIYSALSKNKLGILSQDARMLAGILCAGYFKAGFEDSDDKIFDGKKLWLIDADESVDIYHYDKDLLIDAVVDPRNDVKLKDFKINQINFFKNILHKVVLNYSRNMLSSSDDRVLYVNEFFKEMHWPEDTPEIISIANDKKIYFESNIFDNNYLLYDVSDGFR